jgi:hypothetical protein
VVQAQAPQVLERRVAVNFSNQENSYLRVAWKCVLTASFMVNRAAWNGP